MTQINNTNPTDDAEIAAINERIARAVGYRRYPNTDSIVLERWVHESGDERRTSLVDAPDFFHDWARAGELVAWLESKSVYAALFCDRKSVTLRYACCDIREDDCYHPLFYGHGDSVLEALCNAVIALLDARPELARGEGEAKP